MATLTGGGSAPSLDRARAPLPFPRQLLIAWRPHLESLILMSLAWVLSRPLGLTIPGVEPLALAVALIASRCGFTQGTLAGLAAGLAILASRGLGLPDILALPGDRLALVTAAAMPLTGILIGWMGDAHLAERARLGRERDARQAQLEALQQRHEVLVAAKEAQDHRIVTQSHTLSRLYELARALDVLEPEVLPGIMLELARTLLQAEALSYYRIEGDRLELAGSLGDSPARPGQVPLAGSVLGAVASAGEPHAVVTRAEYRSSGVLMAVPVREPGRPARGVLAIERLPFVRLVPDGLRTLAVLGEWSAFAMARAEAHARLIEQLRTERVAP